jgi:3alpha(or 20beta)-hydroxysteroid dehydrogenase
MGKLDGRVAIITGGARGMGAAEAALFRAEGATVYVTDVRIEEGENTARVTGATFLPHDVANPAQWTDVVERVMTDNGRIDVLVNNAGILSWLPMAATSLELWDQIMAVNQTGVFLGLKTVSPIMIAQKSGSIVNISSIGGLRGSAAAFAYSTSKWAVRGMTKNAAHELGPHGVRVNSVHPGVVDTEMIADFAGRDFMLQRVPMGRDCSPEEVGKVVLFLASDDSGYVNGAEIAVDGGVTA